MAGQRRRSDSAEIGDRSVVAAVEQEIDRIRVRSPGLADSPIAALARSLAGEMDDVAAEEACGECGHVQEWQHRYRNSATSKSLVARALKECLEVLEDRAPAEQEDDEIERARKRRAARHSGLSKAGSSPSS